MIIDFIYDKFLETAFDNTVKFLDKENDNAKILLDSYELPIDEENEAEKIEYVSFHVKDSKLIGYTIDFRTKQNDFGREEVFILAINDDVIFDFPDFSNYMEIPS